MADLPLTERVQSYMKRQRAWLERELAQVQALLANPQGLLALDDTLAAAKTAADELENLEREQHGLLAEWRDEAIAAEARDAILAEAAAIAELAARLGTARAKVAQAIADAQSAVLREQQTLRAGKMRMRRYNLEDISGLNLDVHENDR